MSLTEVSLDRQIIVFLSVPNAISSCRRLCLRYSYLCNDARNSVLANANSYELRYKLRGVSSVRHMLSVSFTMVKLMFHRDETLVSS